VALTFLRNSQSTTTAKSAPKARLLLTRLIAR
jgi:hypothetical protein